MDSHIRKERGAGSDGAMKELRLVVVAHDIPFPPNHGGRVDIWRRLEGFRELGVRVALVTWSYEPPSDEQRRRIARITDALVVLRLERSFAYRMTRLPQLARLPLWVGLRALSRAQKRELMTLATTFAPHGIWLDGIAGGEAAKLMQAACGARLFTRSQNIEFRYHAESLKAAATFPQRVKMLLASHRLESYERAVLALSDHVFDISVDDAETWRAQGISHITWLPPLAPLSQASGVHEPEPAFDAVFLGNLNTPNNLAAIRWLLDEVMPRVRERLPDFRLLIAGSDPEPGLRDRLCSLPGVTLHANPADAIATYRSGRVAVNPARFGSGVSMKLLDMFASGRPVVSTTRGMTGFGDAVSQHLTVADEPEAFALALLAAHHRVVDGMVRASMPERFGLASLRACVDHIKRIALPNAEVP